VAFAAALCGATLFETQRPKDMTEEQFRNALVDKLSALHLQYELGIEIPIPYKHMYVKEGNDIVLEVWCFKQDIVYFKPLIDKSVPYRGANIQANGQPLIRIKLEKDNAQNSKDVGMPFLIIETKNGQPNTHDILTYVQKVEMIKTIFPFCKFVFCISGRISARTYRHGLNFDRIVSLENINDNSEIENFKSLCRGLIQDAEQTLQSISL
jgi:hypothetical protein